MHTTGSMGCSLLVRGVGHSPHHWVHPKRQWVGFAPTILVGSNPTGPRVRLYVPVNWGGNLLPRTNISPLSALSLRRFYASRGEFYWLVSCSVFQYSKRGSSREIWKRICLRAPRIKQPAGDSAPQNEAAKLQSCTLNILITDEAIYQLPVIRIGSSART